jgi:uncharacterized membrane protein
MRTLGFVVVCALALGVAGYAVVVYAWLPLGALLHPEMRATFEAQPLAIYTHVFASVVALTLGPLQFSARLRGRYAAVHRWSGRVYLGVGVLVGGVAALYMATYAFGGVVARLGFACLAAAWLYSGLRAYRAIRAGDVAAHRLWMLRNFALTLAAVMLRLYMPAAVAAGIEFEVAYGPIAWLCWVPNLIVVEVMFNRRRVLHA